MTSNLDFCCNEALRQLWAKSTTIKRDEFLPEILLKWNSLLSKICIIMIDDFAKRINGWLTDYLVVFWDDLESIFSLHDDKTFDSNLRGNIWLGHLDMGPMKVSSTHPHLQWLIGSNQFSVLQTGQELCHVSYPELIDVFKVIISKSISRQFA